MAEVDVAIVGTITDDRGWHRATEPENQRDAAGEEASGALFGKTVGTADSEGTMICEKQSATVGGIPSPILYIAVFPCIQSHAKHVADV